MKRRISNLLIALGIVVTLSILNLFPGKLSAQSSPTKDTEWDGDPATLIESHRGQVLLLLMGMEACPGTREATEALKGYAPEKPEKVFIARMDVPPPGAQLKSAAGKSLPFGYGVDNKRVVADKLEFFFYPTFYILDGEGVVRFSGDCDKDRFPKMVAEILAEKPGDKKHIYTPPLPAEGTKAPSFSGRDLEGNKVTLDRLRGKKATVLIFASTRCVFSMRAVPGMKELEESFQEKQVPVIIINKNESAGEIRSTYRKSAPGMTVVVDEQGEISKSYGVSPVPFCFILDGKSKITKRMPYTQEAATNAINLALGITSGTSPTTESGAG